MGEHRHATTEQPNPVATKQSEPVLPVLMDALDSVARKTIGDDLIARAELGRERYGTYLMTHNGRSAGRDWLDEAYDGCFYATQHWLERGDLRSYNLLLRQIDLAADIKAIVEEEQA